MSGLSNYTKPLEVGYLFTTGASNYTNKNNIFDLAGSLSEFIIESNSNKQISMGSHYEQVSNFDHCAVSKWPNDNDIDTQGDKIGFRVVYYL